MEIISMLLALATLTTIAVLRHDPDSQSPDIIEQLLGDGRKNDQ